MNLNQMLLDWMEITRIKEWRIANNIEVNPEYLAKVNKRDRLTGQFWLYVTVIAFALGVVIGVLI